MLRLQLQFFGGRGASAGGGTRVSVGAALNIGGYTVQRGYVTSPKGGRGYVSEFRDPTEAERRQLARMGVNDPVISGRFVLPRNVAEASVRQVKNEKAALAKNVPGLQALRSAREYDLSQQDRFRQSVYRGDGRIKGNPASVTAAEVAKKYPRAQAYLKAEAYATSANPEKARAGRKAMDKIAGGQSYKKAIQRMEEEWKKAANRRVWD